MNKEAWDVLDKLLENDLEMLFWKTRKCPYFIPLVTLLEKMTTVAMMCYWMILIFNHQKYRDFV